MDTITLLTISQRTATKKALEEYIARNEKQLRIDWATPEERDREERDKRLTLIEGARGSLVQINMFN